MQPSSAPDPASSRPVDSADPLSLEKVTLPRVERSVARTGLAASLLGLSLFVGEASRDDRIDAGPPTRPIAGKTFDYPMRLPAQNLPAQSVRPTAAEDDPNFISSFIVGSRGATLSAELNAKIEQGKKLETNEVSRLFAIIETEQGAAVGLSYCKRFLDATSDAPESTKAILGFITRRSALKPDNEFIKPYLKHDDKSVVALALELTATSSRASMSLEDMNRHYASTDAGVRGAALDLKLAKQPDSVKGLSTLALIEGARDLRTRGVHRGSEVRLAQHLSARINAEGSIKAEDMTAIQVPLIHLLQDIDRVYPGYLKGIHEKGADKLDLVCRELAGELLKSRRELGEKVIAKRGMRMISALHEEPGFVASEMEKFARRFDLKLSTPFKGTADFRTKNPKDDYLKALGELSVAKEPSIVWNAMHGGPNHHWFYSGQAGVEVSDQFRDPRAVSYKEFVEALAKPQLEKANADKTPAVIKLDHITVILDACMQYNFVRNMHQELLDFAKKNDATVESAPLMMSVAQRGMYGWVHRGSDNRSFLQVALDNVAIERGEPLRLKHLYAADQALNRDFLSKLRVHDATFEKVNAEDMAIFDSRFMKPGDILKQIEAQLKKAGLELPKGDGGNRPIIREIGSLGAPLRAGEAC